MSIKRNTRTETYQLIDAEGRILVEAELSRDGYLELVAEQMRRVGR